MLLTFQIENVAQTTVMLNLCKSVTACASRIYEFKYIIRFPVPFHMNVSAVLLKTARTHMVILAIVAP